MISYRIRNPNFITTTAEVDRNDYFIVTIDFRGTALLRKEINSDNANKVVCKEIQRRRHFRKQTLSPTGDPTPVGVKRS